MPATPNRRGRPKGTGADPAQTTIQALDRALEVLLLLSAHEGMTLTEIAKALDQSVATIHRVLATLEAREFVELSPEGQEWHIGPMAFRIGSAFLRRTNLLARSRNTMHGLMQQTGETSNLGIEWKGGVLFVSQVETHEVIRAFFPPGTVSPLHASGIGKALLASQDDARIEEVLRGADLGRFTDRTITSAEALRADLALTRTRGYAVDDEERTPGMRCVAASICNVYGEAVAGISVSGPSSRMAHDRLPGIGAAVRAAADDISRRIGAPV